MSDTIVEQRPANPKAGQWAERIAAIERSSNDRLSPLCWPQWWPSHPAGTIQIRRSQLTERAGQLGEGERLASAGHHVTHSALSAATAVLFEKAKSPKNGPFPPKPGRRLLTGSATEFEVEESASANRFRTDILLVNNASPTVLVA